MCYLYSRVLSLSKLPQTPCPSSSNKIKWRSRSDGTWGFGRDQSSDNFNLSSCPRSSKMSLLSLFPLAWKLFKERYHLKDNNYLLSFLWNIHGMRIFSVINLKISTLLRKNILLILQILCIISWISCFHISAEVSNILKSFT